MGDPVPDLLRPVRAEADPQTLRTAEQVLRDSFTVGFQRYRLQSASALTAQFTDEQLWQAVAFSQAPVNAAAGRKVIDFLETLEGLPQLDVRLRAETRAAICAARDCTVR